MELYWRRIDVGVAKRHDVSLASSRDGPSGSRRTKARAPQRVSSNFTVGVDSITVQIDKVALDIHFAVAAARHHILLQRVARHLRKQLRRDLSYFGGESSYFKY